MTGTQVMQNRNTLFTVTSLAICFLALGILVLSPIAQAISPPPDGGYPGGNTAEGQNALLSLSTGTYNTAVGFLSLLSNATNNFNTAAGAGALLANTADGNTATGAGALLSNTSGSYNTADGVFALFSNTEGHDNAATGDYALFSNTTGSNNTASGRLALYNNTTGSENTALGIFAGHELTTGNNNIDIGNNVLGVAGESNTIRIGDNDITDTFIRGISGTTIASGDAVLVASNGHLGTLTSSARFKDEIKPMDRASEALFSLKPVTFRYKKEIDPARIQQLGLVAEDVEKVNADLVTRDAEGKVNSVRYDQVNAMLLNEFLKTHHKMEEQQKQIDGLTAQLKKQAAEIQTVRVQLELKRPVPQTVASTPQK